MMMKGNYSEAVCQLIVGLEETSVFVESLSVTIL